MSGIGSLMMDTHEEETFVLVEQLFITLLLEYFKIDRERRMNDLTDIDGYLVLSLGLVEE